MISILKLNALDVRLSIRAVEEAVVMINQGRNYISC